MAEVSVVYIDNTDVNTIIKSVGVKQKRAGTIVKVRKKADQLASAFADLSADRLQSNSPKVSGKKKAQCEKDDQELEHKILSAAGSVELMNDEACDNGSSSVYSFKTPKRANQMAKYAANSAQKRNPNNACNNSDKVLVCASKKSTCVPPVACDKSDSTSSYKLRTRKSVNIIDYNDEITSSESDQSDMELDGEDATPLRSLENSSRFQLPSEVELYFEAHTKKTNQVATSDRTLQGLRNPRMGVDELSEVLEEHKKALELVDDVQDVFKCQAHLKKSYEALFTKWLFYLCNGYNLLLFGLGSKRELIHIFCEKRLKNRSKLIVNGFFPGLSIRTILTSIIEDIMESSSGHSNVEMQLNEIIAYYSTNKSRELFLIIHNIDGMTLRASHVQNILSKMAATSQIHVIASIDHINAPLIWTQTVSCRFNWLWYDVTTYTPYEAETSYEGSLLLTGAGAGVSARGAALALSGLIHVARSLTSNARGVFRILAEREIEDKENTENEKIEEFSFFDLYQKCREKFLVNSELTLRAHLTEFVDHTLVQVKKGSDGCEYLTVPLNIETLKEYLDQEDSL